MLNEQNITLKQNNKTCNGISYIVNNEKYPSFLREHEVFKKLTKIKKVFPSIGLPNSLEEVEYSDINSVVLEAQTLVHTSIRNELYRALDNITPALRNSELNQTLCALNNKLYYDYHRMVQTQNNKVVIKFDNNISINFNNGEIIVAKKDESLFKVYTKLVEKLKDVNIQIKKLEDIDLFKSFSANNVPNKKYNLVFSSTGEEGAWDIATISMRGINSCQSWGTLQSRGLIGSISSRFVGVIYLTSGHKFNDHGSKMMRRAMVRYCINTKTKKPALLMDRVYPATNDNLIIKIFSDFLSKKTGLPVITPCKLDWANYHLPSDSFEKFITFQPSELTYMDTQIARIPQKVKNIQLFQTAINSLDRRLEVAVSNRLSKLLDEYAVDKTQHAEYLKGGVANLYISYHRHNPQNLCNYIFPKLWSSYGNLPKFPDYKKYEDEAVGVRQYTKHFIMATLKCMENIENLALSSLGNLPFIKFYPKSKVKLIKLLVHIYKQELIKEYKNLIN